MMAARSGKMPTTSVRRRTSLFNRSCGLLDQIWILCESQHKILNDGQSRSGSRSRGWPEARTPDWPGPSGVPRISLRILLWTSRPFASRGQDLVDLAGDIALQATDDLGF